MSSLLPPNDSRRWSDWARLLGRATRHAGMRVVARASLPARVFAHYEK